MMKKTYVKPEIMFEDFTLCSNIATGCESIVGSPTKGSCAVESSGGIKLFDNTIPACDYSATDVGFAPDTYYNKFCYHVPTESNNLFNS